ncbi:MAG TPA: prephenate dehydrogenase/arogenate dehydrogenase family protein [Vicinamibacteria bacterium]
MSVSRRRPTVAIVGLGLVGGSLARALSRAGYAVIGVDRPAVARRAWAARAVGRIAASLEEAADLSDVVVLAAPPAANLRLLRRLARRARPGLVITDVGSVKGPICREADRAGLAFVGGHPMAGTERSGFGASSAGLFRGRSWILCPGRRASRDAVAAVRRVARAVGARPVHMSPAEHDRTVAFLSHAPQLVSWALVEAARADPVARRRLAVAGPGFAGMTRLAASPSGLWRDILAQNRRETDRAIGALMRALRGRL